MTTHAPSSTFLVDEKGRLFFVYIDPPASPTAVVAERQRREAESKQLILAQAGANEAALQKEVEDPTWSGEARIPQETTII